MNCSTCSFFTVNQNLSCTVNPTHCKGGWTQACKEYEHDFSKEIRCGNCAAFSIRHCSLLHLSVDASEKGCINFLSNNEVEEELARWEQYQPQVIASFEERELIFKLIKELFWQQDKRNIMLYTCTLSMEELYYWVSNYIDKGILAHEEDGQLKTITWKQNEINEYDLVFKKEYTFF